METGEPPETKDLRPMVDRLLGEEPTSSETFSTAVRKLASLNFLASIACLSVAIITSANIYSSAKTPKVDNLQLTADEKDFIRKLRSEHLNFAQLDAEVSRLETQVTARLINMGARDAEDLRRKENLLSWAQADF